MLVDMMYVAAAAVMAWLLTPLAAKLGHKLNMVDEPDGPLKIHSKPTPRTGGIALALTLMILQTVSELLHRPLLTGAEFAVAMLLFGLGLWDDRRPRSARLRLLLQLAIYSVGFTSGLKLHWFGSPWADFAAGLVLFIVVINAINFYDGMDGLLALTGVAALGVWGMYVLELGGDAFVPFVAAAMRLGFLPRNWHPARIFLGDGGSFIVGFFFYLVFTRGIAYSPEPAAGLWVVAMPVCDAMAATLDRLVRRRDIWSGDRDHIYDILARLRWSAPRIAIFLSLAAAILARLAGRIMFFDAEVQWVATAFLYACTVAWIMLMRHRHRAP